MGAGAALQPYCDEFSDAPTSFNGNDALELLCDGVLLDSIGQVGTDPGTFWGVEPTTTLDHTLRRNAGIEIGDTASDNPFDPGNEWTSFAQDTFDGLGTR